MGTEPFATSDVGPFSIVPRWLRDACKGDPWPVVLYACLADHADRAGDGGWTIGRQQLADELGVSTKTVDRATKHLEAIEAIEVVRQKRNGENIWSRYFIRLAALKVATPVSLGGDYSSPGGDTRVALPIEPPIKTQKMRDESFEEFWQGYPKARRISKPAALKAWRQIAAKDHLLVMLALSAWVMFWEASKTEDHFIPYPQKWLNQKYWENPPETKPAPVEVIRPCIMCAAPNPREECNGPNYIGEDFDMTECPWRR